MFLEALESRQLMSAGDLDPTFGAGGKILAADTVGFPVADMAVQSDGKVVLVGSLNNDFAITRFNANGTIDRSFGGSGFVRTDFGGVKDIAKAVAIQADGKILIAGQRESDHRGDDRAVLVRLNSNGTPDSTFDGDGKRVLDVKGSGANALALLPDGKILVAGGKDSGTFNINDDFFVARLLPNSAADSTFGNFTSSPFDGDKRTGSAAIDFHADTQGEEATMISLAPGGKIVLAGTGGNGQVLNTQKLAVTRLTSNGTIDSSFTDGISGAGKSNNLLLFANYKDMTVAADGSVTVVGGINGNVLTVRIKSSGGLDTAFNGTGHIITDLGGNDQAKNVLVNREGILVAGGSSGKFALLRYKLNGTLDASFGNGGTRITSVGPDDAILTSTLSADGRLTAFGRTGGAARYFTAAPKVNVFSLRPNGAEGGDNPSLIFTRDLRLSFPTRVFFDLGGTATLGADYTGPSTTTIFVGGTKLPNGSLTPVTPVRVGFIDIPANETTAIVPINVIDDKALDPVETVTATIRASALYTLGNRITQTDTIADNDIARVNFQVTPTPFAFAYEPDLGLPFGTRPNGQQFGWNVDNRANARDRGFSAAPGMGLLYTTFNHMQKPGGGSKWEFAVPNGMYQVKLAAGDPLQTDSDYRMNLEGQLALSGKPSGTVRWFERTINVQVNDGRLTLSNAAGASNNKIAFVEIRSAGLGATAGPVTVNVPVNLPAAAVTHAKVRTDGTIFSQMQI
jgi:uncharacterized delta-60 repeat protein